MLESGDSYWSSLAARTLRRRRLLRGGAFAAAGSVIMALAGCGGANNSSRSTTGTTTSAAASATSATRAASAATTAVTTSAATASPAAARPTQAPAGGQRKSGGSLRMRAYVQGPLNFDPFPLITARVLLYTGMIYESLLTFKYGPDVKLGSFAPDPMLATSWETPDTTTYVFHLRQGVKFHNKPPVNARAFVAQDVLYSLQRRMVKESPYYGTMYSLVKDIQAPDAQTVRITLNEPFTPFLAYLGTYFGTIVAPEVEKQFGDYSKPESAIGTGRWILDSFEPNVKSLFKKNPDYYLKGLPYVDEDQEIVVTDDAAALAAFNSQQLDYDGVALAKGDIDSLKQSNPKATVLPASTVGRASVTLGIFFSMRTDKKPFDDVRVRQAMALAIDRDGMITGLHEGASYQPGPVPAAYGDWALPVDKLGAGAKYYKRDVTAAKQLLSAAGYANGFDTEAWTVNVAPNWLYDDFDFLQKNLADVGVKVKLVKQDYAAFAQTTQVGKQDQMGFLTAGGNLPDVDSVLYRYYYPNQGSNVSHADDAKLSDMLTAQRREPDQNRRMQAVSAIQQYLAEQQYILFAPQRDAFEALQPWVKGLGPSTYGDLLSAYETGVAMSNWWIDRG